MIEFVNHVPIIKLYNGDIIADARDRFVSSKRKPKLKKPKFPMRERLAYIRDLKRIFREADAIIKARLDIFLKNTVEKGIRPNQFELDFFIRDLRLEMGTQVLNDKKVNSIIVNFLNRTSVHSEKQVEAVANAARAAVVAVPIATIKLADIANAEGIAIDIFSSSPNLSRTLTDLAKDQSRLIKSMPEVYLDRVQSVIEKGIKDGETIDTLRKKLERIPGISERRAELIANLTRQDLWHLDQNHTPGIHR